MNQLEAIGKMIKAKRDERISQAAHEAAMNILLEVEASGVLDPREVAYRISEAVKDLVNDPHK